MIELLLWEEKINFWETELISNRKYQLKNVPELAKVVGSGSINNSKNQKKEDSFIYDLCKFKKFIISDIPTCLEDEKIIIYIILGAIPKVGIDLELVPEYIKNDESLLEDSWKFIIEEIIDLFKSGSQLKNLYEGSNLKIIDKLKTFPKDINKREDYYYNFCGISSNYLIKDNPKHDYWSSFNVCYKISLFEEEYLIDIKHSGNGGNRVMIYSYKTKEEISSKLNYGVILELFNYYLWKI